MADGRIKIIRNLESDELEQSESVEPDTPETRKIAARIRAWLNRVGWDTGEKILADALGLVLVKTENDKRFYERADGKINITFKSG